ncbi:MAG: OmpA family protein [Pseudomonadaceae bacterium]
MKLLSALSLGSALVLLTACSSTKATPPPPPAPQVTPWAQLHMDELRTLAAEERYELEHDGDEVRLIIPVNGNFHPKRTLLLPSGLVPLSRVAKLLRGATDSHIQVTGYSDSSGDDHLNQQLSMERAQAVASVLQLGGVSRRNMELISLGEANPRADNSTAAGREQNRRVVINITPRATASAVALAP